MKDSGFDVLIVGGGMVGAALALALAPLDRAVAVVEARPGADRQAPGYDDRSTALSAGSRRMLELLGIWPRVASNAAPIRRVHVSEAGRLGNTVLDASELALDALGWVVENPVLQQAFDEALADRPSITRIQPASVTALHDEGDGVTVTVDRGGRVETVTAGLLVGADGAGSVVRELSGIGSSRHAYGQTAVVANFTPALGHRGVAWERFTDDGPFAVLPLTDGRCALVWSLPQDKVDAVLAVDDAAFAAQIEARFGGRLGRVLRVGRRQAWPLERVIADRQHQGNVVLVGNAAHGLHPIAGQGLNLSLRDCAALAEALADDTPLEEWVAGRRADQRRVAGFTDRLNSLFLSELPLAGTLRSAGLAAFGLCGPLRRVFTAYGAGVHAPVPRLIRGVPLR